MAELSVYAPAEMDPQALRDVALRALGGREFQFNIDSDALEYPGYPVVIDLYHPSIQALEEMTQLVRDAVVSELGVQARTEVELDGPQESPERYSGDAAWPLSTNAVPSAMLRRSPASR